MIFVSPADIAFGLKVRSSAGSPTTTSVPVGLSDRKAVSYAALDAAVTIEKCAPPISRICLTALLLALFIVWSAPHDLASSSFSSVMSTAITSAP